MSKDITKAASNKLLGAEWEDSIEAVYERRSAG